ncbi:hypothetical protein A3Q56_04872 [Intoshia linei]|uniref:CCHC-type domain-containing protein n=1 Tax=Intoshia linei TaxID=1819745 RepID=A0A177B1A0_9BILA|nr:hypothetical protein A3Q56_04872 [Intoshia linei]
MLIKSSKVEFTYKNEVIFFATKQLKDESIQEFCSRLKNLTLEISWCQIETNRHICNVLKVNFLRCNLLPIEYWKNEKLNTIVSILTNIPVSNVIPKSIHFADIRCFKCNNRGHIAPRCKIKTTNKATKSDNYRFTKSTQNSVDGEFDDTQKVPIGQIADRLGRSYNCIKNYLLRSKLYIRGGGRPQLLDDRTKRHICLELIKYDFPTSARKGNAIKINNKKIELGTGNILRRKEIFIRRPYGCRKYWAKHNEI